MKAARLWGLFAFSLFSINTAFCTTISNSDKVSKNNAKNVHELKKFSEVEIVTSKAAGTTYASRIKATHRLGGHLSDADLKELYTFLHRKPGTDPLTRGLEFNGVKNETVIALMNQQKYPVDLTRQLVEMYQDKTLGTTWRDYCIQFLSQWYPQTTTAAEKEMIVKTITAAFQEKDNGIAGTAVIAASKLAGKSDFKPDQVGAVAQQLAEDKNVNPVSRISALQVSARMKNFQAVVTARDIIKNQPKVPVMLKMSALAVLGTNGDSSDLRTLEEYRNSSDIRLRAAAAAAWHRLNKQ